MSATSPELLNLVGELRMLLKESAEYQQDAEVKAVFQEALSVVGANHRRLHTSMRRYVVAVVGLTNVGKSTLLNALLGSDLAPRRNGPCTAAPIEFCHGDRLRVVAHRFQSYARSTWDCENPEALHERLARLADDGGADISRATRKVEVRVPHPLLVTGLVIADTPGFGAAQEASASGSHEESLKQYLKEDVSQVFWVVLADQGIGRRERQFHEQLLAEVCDDIVVTGSEEWDSPDRDRFRRRFGDVFGSRLPRFHFVSGLKGIEARSAGDSVGLEAAGITRLEARIRELAEPTGRDTAIREALVELADNLGLWLREHRDQRGLALRHWWRPDSWGRWAASPACQGLRERISDALAESSCRT